jgi:ABC-type multidrug transport system fused ATPase/permease subunit
MLSIVAAGILLIVITVLLQGYGTMYLINRFDWYHNNLTEHNFHIKSLKLLIYTTIFSSLFTLFKWHFGQFPF